MCVVIVYDAMKSHSTAFFVGEGCFATLSASWSELLISHYNLYWAVVYVTTQPRISERLNPTMSALEIASATSAFFWYIIIHSTHGIALHAHCTPTLPPSPPGWWDPCCYNLLILLFMDSIVINLLNST